MSVIIQTIRRLTGYDKRSQPTVAWRDKYWSVAVYSGDSPFSLRPDAARTTPALSPADIAGIDTNLVADPFMIHVKGTWYMFVEILNWSTDKGEIGLAISHDDGRSWQYHGIVLREPHHLSYPFVFEWGGENYMVPEGFRSGELRLYRAVAFPTDWKHAHTLLRGDIFLDSTLFRHDKRWWLFTCLRRESDTVSLYHSDELLGDWRAHPSNPLLAADPANSRPAGRVIKWNGCMYRLAQDCTPEYGKRVRANEILELTPNRYREQAIDTNPVLDASGIGWNSMGMHHLDAHQLRDDRWIACVDGWTVRRTAGRIKTTTGGME